MRVFPVELDAVDITIVKQCASVSESAKVTELSKKILAALPPEARNADVLIALTCTTDAILQLMRKQVVQMPGASGMVQ